MLEGGIRLPKSPPLPIRDIMTLLLEACGWMELMLPAPKPLDLPLLPSQWNRDASPVPGRSRTSIRGSLSSNDNLVGGMIDVDHASSKIFVNFQAAFSSAEAVHSKVATLRLRHAIKGLFLLPI